MNILETIIQGIIQGLTEFLPVSSSGHLSLYQHFTGSSGESSFLLTAVLHLGTLVAVFIAFKSIIFALIKEFFVLIGDIFTGKFKWKTMNGERRMIIMLLISTLMLIPFYICKGTVERVSTDNDIIFEGFCFIYTSVLLFLSDKCVKGGKEKEGITVKNAVSVGIFQGVALLPGISRSGSTICGGLFNDFSRQLAVAYSFILGIPAILGGCLLEVKDAVDSNTIQVEPVNFVVGFAVAAVVGLLSIKMVNLLINKNKFSYFAVYTAVLGVTVIILGLVGM